MTEDYKSIKQEREKAASAHQYAAADPRISAWVEASAGTGKTKVLTDRVLRLLLAGTAPGRILCLTYTKAAAAEMKSRISGSLGKWSVQSDAELADSIQKLTECTGGEVLNRYMKKARTLFAVLLDTPGGMKIQDIHSFCTYVLKRFPLEAGVSPYFEVLDDRAANDALLQIRDATLSGKSGCPEEETEAVGYLASRMNEDSFAAMMSDITQKHTEIEEGVSAFGGFDKMLESLRKKLGVADDDTEEKTKYRFMADIDKEKLAGIISAMEEWGKKAQKCVPVMADILEKGCHADRFEDYKNCLLVDEKSPRQLTPKKAADSPEAKALQQEAERVMAALHKCLEIRVYRSTKAFMTLARGINGRYEDYKRARSYLDYEDLIVKTSELLSEPGRAEWVLYKLDGGIDHILLDEAQDTSPRQWNIIKALSEEFFAGEGVSSKIRTVFAVGDRKQSIFSFQGADPRKFDEMSRYFAARAGANFRKVDMSFSFRSAPAILDSVNDVFSDEKVSEGVISSGESFEHVAVKAGYFGRVEVWPLIATEQSAKVIDEQKYIPPKKGMHKVSVYTLAARKVAAEIKRLVAESSNSPRPLSYGDFMILVRTRNTFVDEFIRACKEMGVNISGADKMKLSGQIAVQDLVSLGKFLLLPDDDLSLAEVLKSPLYNLTDKDLEVLCCKRKNAPLWTSLGNNSHYSEVYKSLQNLFDMLDFVRPYELFNYVMNDMQGRKKFMKRLGVEAEDALDEFMNLTLAYEQSQTPDLQGFISWFEHDATEVKREGEDTAGNAVRLMTVHHSKGLQARVVILPDCVGLPRNKKEQGLMFDDDGQIFYPLCSADYDDNCKRIKDRVKTADLEEYRRLLYVALTRAEERLIICGYVKTKDKDKDKDEDKDKDNNKDKGISPDSWFSICRNAMQKSVHSLESVAGSEEEIMVKQSPQLAEVEPIKTVTDTEGENIPEPSWTQENAPDESPLAKPYTPSAGDENDDDEDTDSVSPLESGAGYYRRGALIHKILQFLPADNGDKAAAADEYLRKNASDFSDSEKEQIKTEILNLLSKEEYAPLFGRNSRAEVPVFGELDGRIVSARIDRLAVLPDKIMIVDFKTNRPAKKTLAETPDVYKKQLETYERLVKRIYPSRKVESYILWTNEARLMRVS